MSSKKRRSRGSVPGRPLIVDSDADSNPAIPAPYPNQHQLLGDLLRAYGTDSVTEVSREFIASFDRTATPDRQHWERYLRFFKLLAHEADPRVDEDAQPVHRHTLVEIPGVAIRLKPYQAWAAYSILSEEKRKRGGFLADEMGLGKNCIELKEEEQYEKLWIWELIRRPPILALDPSPESFERLQRLGIVDKEGDAWPPPPPVLACASRLPLCTLDDNLSNEVK